MAKEMKVIEKTSYTIGEFTCPHCGEHHTIHCSTKRENPSQRKRTRHWVK